MTATPIENTFKTENVLEILRALKNIKDVSEFDQTIQKIEKIISNKSNPSDREKIKNYITQETKGVLVLERAQEAKIIDWQYYNISTVHYTNPTTKKIELSICIPILQDYKNISSIFEDDIANKITAMLKKNNWKSVVTEININSKKYSSSGERLSPIEI